jgi:hypothetical protein
MEPVSGLPMFVDSFLWKLSQLNNIEFFRDHASGDLAERRKLCMNCHNEKKTLFFAEIHVQYNVPKYMLGIWIPVRSDQDLFKHVLILERTMAVRAMNLWSCHPSCCKNLPNLRTLIFHLWMRYSLGRSFKTADFQTEKCVPEP